MIGPLTIGMMKEAAAFSAGKAIAAGYTVRDPDQWENLLMTHILLQRAIACVEDGHVVGVGIYGISQSAEQSFRDGYSPAQKDGQVIWCPFMAATGPRQIIGMIRYAAARHPQAHTLAYRRRRVHLVKISLRRTHHGWKSSLGRYGHGQVPARSGA